MQRQIPLFQFLHQPPPLPKPQPRPRFITRRQRSPAAHIDVVVARVEVGQAVGDVEAEGVQVRVGRIETALRRLRVQTRAQMAR